MASRYGQWCREGQVKQLKELGVEHVFNTSEDKWDEQLKETCQKVNAKFCFDAVAGATGSAVFAALPIGARHFVYGDLPGEPFLNLAST